MVLIVHVDCEDDQTLTDDFDLTSLDRFDLAGSVLQVSYVTYTKNPKDAFIVWPQSMKNVKFIAMI